MCNKKHYLDQKLRHRLKRLIGKPNNKKTRMLAFRIIYSTFFKVSNPRKYRRFKRKIKPSPWMPRKYRYEGKISEVIIHKGASLGFTEQPFEPIKTEGFTILGSVPAIRKHGPEIVFIP